MDKKTKRKNSCKNINQKPKRKYYLQSGKCKRILLAKNLKEACKLFIILALKEKNGKKLAALIGISEAGFLEDINNYGTKKQREQYNLISTESILNTIEMESQIEKSLNEPLFDNDEDEDDDN